MVSLSKVSYCEFFNFIFNFLHTRYFFPYGCTRNFCISKFQLHSDKRTVCFTKKNWGIWSYLISITDVITWEIIDRVIANLNWLRKIYWFFRLIGWTFFLIVSISSNPFLVVGFESAICELIAFCAVCCFSSLYCVFVIFFSDKDSKLFYSIYMTEIMWTMHWWKRNNFNKV